MVRIGARYVRRQAAPAEVQQEASDGAASQPSLSITAVEKGRHGKPSVQLRLARKADDSAAYSEPKVEGGQGVARREEGVTVGRREQKVTTWSGEQGGAEGGRKTKVSGRRGEPKVSLGRGEEAPPRGDLRSRLVELRRPGRASQEELRRPRESCQEELVDRFRKELKVGGKGTETLVRDPTQQQTVGEEGGAQKPRKLQEYKEKGDVDDGGSKLRRPRVAKETGQAENEKPKLRRPKKKVQAEGGESEVRRPTVGQAEEGECVCLRPVKLVMCQECGATFPGRSVSDLTSSTCTPCPG